MSILTNVPISAIDPNPFRNIATYPFIDRKLDALRRSIEQAGFWEGIIAREMPGGRYQLAFGHHRVEAARRFGLRSIPLIVRMMTDAQMLVFMARENMEDYNSNFLAMLETWEAAVTWFKATGTEARSPIDVASFLGWTQNRTGSDGVQMNRTAEACNAARTLLLAGHVNRPDLADMSVQDAREILVRAKANIERIERTGLRNHTSPDAIEASKRAVSHAIKATVEQSRDVRNNDLRARLDINAARAGHVVEKDDNPLFQEFARSVSALVDRMLADDSAADKIDKIIKGRREVGPGADWGMIERIRDSLRELVERAEKLDARLVAASEDKVVSITKALGAGK